MSEFRVEPKNRVKKKEHVCQARGGGATRENKMCLLPTRHSIISISISPFSSHNSIQSLLSFSPSFLSIYLSCLSDLSVYLSLSHTHLHTQTYTQTYKYTHTYLHTHSIVPKFYLWVPMAISPPTIRFVDSTSQFAHCSRSKLGGTHASKMPAPIRFAN